MLLATMSTLCTLQTIARLDAGTQAAFLVRMYAHPAGAVLLLYVAGSFAPELSGALLHLRLQAFLCLC